MSWDAQRRKLEELKVSEGTVSARLKDLMIRREILTEPMSFKAITDTYYGITGKRLPVSYVNQYLQPFQDRGIVRREMVTGKIHGTVLGSLLRPIPKARCMIN